MKKIISLVLTAAMLLTMVFTMSGLQVFAADNLNLLDQSKTSESLSDGRAGSFEYLSNGGIKLTATGAKGYGVAIDLNQEFTVADLKFLQMDVTSTANFNVAMNVETKTGSGWPQLATDWYTDFQEAAPAEGAGINPVTGFHKAMPMDGYFTYNNNANLPDDGKSTVIKVSIALYGPGELTMNWMQLSGSDTFTVEAGGTTAAGGTDTTTAAAAAATTTVAAAATTAATTAAATSNAKTGEDTTLVVMMVAAMAVAGTVIAVMAVGKKSRAK